MTPLFNLSGRVAFVTRAAIPIDGGYSSQA
jgi:hypothetical protein